MSASAIYPLSFPVSPSPNSIIFHSLSSCPNPTKSFPVSSSFSFIIFFFLYLHLASPLYLFLSRHLPSPVYLFLCLNLSPPIYIFSCVIIPQLNYIFSCIFISHPAVLFPVSLHPHSIFAGTHGCVQSIIRVTSTTKGSS